MRSVVSLYEDDKDLLDGIYFCLPTYYVDPEDPKYLQTLGAYAIET